MAGIKLTIDDTDIQKALTKLAKASSDLSIPMAQVGEHILHTTRERFRTQQSPDGIPWQALSKKYKKKRNKDKILTERGHLQGQLVMQSNKDSAAVGSNRIYAAIHQFGGDINMPARQRELFFKRTKDGGVSNKFVKPKKSDFSQTVITGSYSIKIPARPYLGLSDTDKKKVLSILTNHLKSALN